MLWAKLKATELKASQEEVEKEDLKHKLEQMEGSQAMIQDFSCPECGFECQQDDQFCGDCGHRMNNWTNLGKNNFL